MGEVPLYRRSDTRALALSRGALLGQTRAFGKGYNPITAKTGLTLELWRSPVARNGNNADKHALVARAAAVLGEEP